MHRYIARLIIVCGSVLLLLSCSHATTGSGLRADPPAPTNTPGTIPDPSDDSSDIIDDGDGVPPAEDSAPDAAGTGAVVPPSGGGAGTVPQSGCRDSLAVTMDIKIKSGAATLSSNGRDSFVRAAPPLELALSPTINGRRAAKNDMQYTYEWSVDGAVFSTTMTQGLRYESPIHRTYTLAVTDTVCNTIEAATVTIDIESPPCPYEEIRDVDLRFEIDAGSRGRVIRSDADVVLGTAPLTVKFLADHNGVLTGDPAFEYDWFVDGHPTFNPLDTNYVTTFTHEGTFSVKVRVKDACGNVLSDHKEVRIFEEAGDSALPAAGTGEQAPSPARSHSLTTINLGTRGDEHAVAAGGSIALVVKATGDDYPKYQLIDLESNSAQTSWIPFSGLEDGCPNGQRLIYTAPSAALNSSGTVAYIAFTKSCWRNRERQSRDITVVKLDDGLRHQSDPFTVGMSGNKFSPLVMANRDDFGIAWISNFGSVPVSGTAIYGGGYGWLDAEVRAPQGGYYEIVLKVYFKVFPVGRNPIAPRVLHPYARLGSVPDSQYEPAQEGTLTIHETESYLQGTGCGTDEFCVSFERQLVNVDGRTKKSQELFAFNAAGNASHVTNHYDPARVLRTSSLTPVVGRNELFEIRTVSDVDHIYLSIWRADASMEDLRKVIVDSVDIADAPPDRRGVSVYRDGSYHLWLDGESGFSYYRMSEYRNASGGEGQRSLTKIGEFGPIGEPLNARHAINQDGKIISIWMERDALKAIIGTPWTEDITPAAF